MQCLHFYVHGFYFFLLVGFSGILYLLMRNSAGRVYYLRLGKEGRRPVADIRPKDIDEIDPNSEVIAIIQPKKNEKGEVVRCGVITSKEYRDKSQSESESEQGFPDLFKWKDWD